MDLRERLVQRIRQLPEATLPQLETAIAALDCGGSTPLSIAPQGSAATPSSHGRQRNSAPSPAGGVIVHAATIQGSQRGVVPPHSKELPAQPKAWPHAPVHRIAEHGTYIVTAGTLHKEHFFGGDERLDFLEGKLLELAAQHGWELEAWAVFSNHYHFVAHSHATSGALNVFLGHLHSATAAEINRQDKLPERQVWHNFWDTRLTYEKSYLARLNYVHQNAVHHRLVPVANQYRHCSAAWFERTATRAQVATIYGFRIDRVKVFDEFEV